MRLLELAKTLGETPAKKVGAEMEKDINTLNKKVRRARKRMMRGGGDGDAKELKTELKTAGDVYVKDLTDSIRSIHVGLAKIDNQMKTIMEDLTTTADGKEERLAIFDDAVASTKETYEEVIATLKKKKPKSAELKAILANLEGGYASFSAEAPLQRKIIEVSPESGEVSWAVSFYIKLKYTAEIIKSSFGAVVGTLAVAMALGVEVYAGTHPGYVTNDELVGAYVTQIYGVVALIVSQFTCAIGSTTRTAFLKYKNEPVPSSFYDSFLPAATIVGTVLAGGLGLFIGYAGESWMT
jgi:hypothetical protein